MDHFMTEVKLQLRSSTVGGITARQEMSDTAPMCICTIADKSLCYEIFFKMHALAESHQSN